MTLPLHENMKGMIDMAKEKNLFCAVFVPDPQDQGGLHALMANGDVTLQQLCLCIVALMDVSGGQYNEVILQTVRSMLDNEDGKTSVIDVDKNLH